MNHISTKHDSQNLNRRYSCAHLEERSIVERSVTTITLLLINKSIENYIYQMGLFSMICTEDVLLSKLISVYNTPPSCVVIEWKTV